MMQGRTELSRFRRLLASLFLVLAAIILTASNNPLVVEARKQSRNTPHHHRGQLKPYKPGPFQDIQLTAAEEALLAKGGAVMKQTMPTDPSESGTAICVQDVQAPLSAVWHQILDLENYSQKVSKVKECTNYYVQRHKDGSVTIKTKQVLGVLPGYSYESYYDHTFHPDKSSLTWTLDYDKTSDFDDVAGHWHVAPSKQPACSRVYYACDIQMKGKVPGPVLNYISKAALKQATAWVKKESEAHPNKTIPKAFGGNDAIAAVAKKSEQPELVGAGGSSSSSASPAPRTRGLWGRKQ